MPRRSRTDGGPCVRARLEPPRDDRRRRMGRRVETTRPSQSGADTIAMIAPSRRDAESSRADNVDQPAGALLLHRCPGPLRAPDAPHRDDGGTRPPQPSHRASDAPAKPPRCERRPVRPNRSHSTHKQCCPQMSADVRRPETRPGEADRPRSAATDAAPTPERSTKPQAPINRRGRRRRRVPPAK